MLRYLPSIQNPVLLQISPEDHVQVK